MDTSTIRCDIVSAEEAIFSGDIEMLSATGTVGELGIYPGHTPLLTSLKPGPVEIRLDGGELMIFYVSSGYLEVQPKIITLLSDTAARATDLDEAAVLAARQEAENAIQDRTSEFDYSKAVSQLAQATAQLRTLQELRRKLKK